MIVTATALPRVMHCDGPISLAAFAVASDSDQSESAIEGNAAHKLMQMALTSGQECAEFIGQTVNGNYIITDEMADYVQQHVDTFAERDNVSIEEPAEWTTHHGDVINGRADFISFTGNVLHVDDLKYGWRIVEPEENWTLISHAIGYCLKHGLQPDRIDITIHQPRPWHNKGTIRTWSITLDQMQAFQNRIRDRLASIANMITSGPHCYKCSVAHVCPSSRLAALNAIDVAFNGDAQQLDGSAIGAELRLIERAKSALDIRYKALEAQAEEMLRTGKSVNGYGLDFAYGRKTWNKEVNAATIKMLTGVDISKQDMLTPAQAKKKGVPEHIIDSMTHSPSRGYKIVHMDTDKLAKELFKNG